MDGVVQFISIGYLFFVHNFSFDNCIFGPTLAHLNSHILVKRLLVQASRLVSPPSLSLSNHTRSILYARGKCCRSNLQDFIMKIDAPPVISSSYHLPINKTKVLFQRIKLSSNSLFSIRNPETMKLQISLRLLSLNSRIFISSGGEQRCFWCERCPPVGSWAGNECYLVLN